jgi:EAL domain-containing protein (putative c-di-GMP-specific phosphodiesterase class I)
MRGTLPATCSSVCGNPIECEGVELNVSCSVGVALYPDDATVETALLSAADAALYQAKRFRNSWHRYTTDSERPDVIVPFAFSAVRRALDDKQIDVHYQPLIETSTCAVHGVEALVRWRDVEGRMVPPAELIRLSEDAGLIAALTERVLAIATEQVASWLQAGTAPRLQLAINVSGNQLGDPGLLAMVDRTLRASGLPPRNLEIEITETAVMRPRTAAASSLAALRDLGVRIAVDDFGTGYSSLSRLQRLPVDALKIDRSFVEGVAHSEESRALVRAIVAMAHSLRLSVTAEGVERADQLAFLNEVGCDRVQGFLFSPALPAAAFASFLHTHTTPVI